MTSVEYVREKLQIGPLSPRRVDYVPKLVITCGSFKPMPQDGLHLKAVTEKVI